MPSSRSLALALAVFASAAFAAPGRLVVPADVVVEADPVRLRDVAVLEGEGAVVLADVVLMPAPRAGESRTIDGNRLLETLRRAGVDAAVTYTLPATLRVRRATQEVPPDAVRALVEAWLLAQLGDGARDAVLQALDTHGTIVVPTGTWTGEVSAPRGVAPIGRVRLALALAVDGVAARTVWLTAQIARYGAVVVPTRQIARGEVLAATDLTVQRLELSQLSSTVLTQTADAEGAVARQTLTAYAPVRREYLGTPLAVRRGDTVVLLARRGALQLTAPAEVRQDAARGEQVTVLNRTSGKTVVGRVLDPGTVAVEF